MSTKYISPTGSGNKSGSSIDNAAPIAALNSMVTAAGPGGTVNLLADQGVYKVTKALNIYGSGADGAPVTVQGISSTGATMAAKFEGTRTVDWTAGSKTGNELFKLQGGASNLTFQNIEIANVGTAFRVGGALSNLTIENVAATNVQRFFEDYASGTATDATIDGLTIRNVDVEGFSKGVIRLKYDTHNVLIENVHGDSQRQDGDNFAIGVHVSGTAHDITISKSVMENATDTIHSYWNGDGFATERGTYNIVFKDTVARGNTDGGYDLKSTSTTLIRTVAEDNARNYRIWGEVTMIDPVGLNPHKYGGTGSQYQVWVNTNAKLSIEGGLFADSGSSTHVFINEGILNVSGTTVVMADNAPLIGTNPLTSFLDSTVTKIAATGTYSTGIFSPEILSALTKEAVETGTTDSSSLDSLFSIQKSTSANETFTATSGRDKFDFTTEGNFGADKIKGFGRADVIVFHTELWDSNHDDIITFGRNRILDTGDGTVNISKMPSGLRYLGQTSEGYVYGAAKGRPTDALEGKLGVNDTFAGDSSDKAVSRFFFDTALHENLGDDTITRFGTKDVVITTSLLGSSQIGSTIAMESGHFNLVDHGADVGHLAISDMYGAAVSALEYDGSMTVGDLTYYVYSAVGSPTELAPLFN